MRAYLPDLRLADEAVAARVTLRHLFTHTGGWAGDYFPDTGEGDDALARAVARLADVPQLTPLGAMWSYNNAGFYLAGRVLEVVAGQPYEALVQERLLAAAGHGPGVLRRRRGDHPPRRRRAPRRGRRPGGGAALGPGPRRPPPPGGSSPACGTSSARPASTWATAPRPAGGRLLSAAALAGMRARRWWPRTAPAGGWA